MDEFALDGVTILIASLDVPETLGMADRVLVLRAGKVQAELAHNEANEVTIMRAATGQIAESAP